MEKVKYQRSGGTKSPTASQYRASKQMSKNHNKHKCPISKIVYCSLFKRVYGQFSIETIHERRKRNREFVLLIRIGKQNVKIIEK